MCLRVTPRMRISAWSTPASATFCRQLQAPCCACLTPIDNRRYLSGSTAELRVAFARSRSRPPGTVIAPRRILLCPSLLRNPAWGRSWALLPERQLRGKEFPHCESVIYCSVPTFLPQACPVSRNQSLSPWLFASLAPIVAARRSRRSESAAPVPECDPFRDWRSRRQESVLSQRRSPKLPPGYIPTQSVVSLRLQRSAESAAGRPSAP